MIKCEINEWPTKPGVYRMQMMPLPRAMFAPVFAEYWDQTGKKELLDLLKKTPYSIGMFYKPGGFDDEGNPLQPTTPGWEKTDFLNTPEFEAALEKGLEEPVWFQPGNVVTYEAKEDEKDYVVGLQFYLVVGVETATDIPNTFDLEQVLTSIQQASGVQQVGGYSRYQNLGSLLVAGAVGTVALGSLLALSIGLLLKKQLPYLSRDGIKGLTKTVSQTAADTIGKRLDQTVEKAIGKAGETVEEKGKVLISALKKAAEEAIPKLLQKAGEQLKEVLATGVEQVREQGEQLLEKMRSTAGEVTTDLKKELEDLLVKAQEAFKTTASESIKQAKEELLDPILRRIKQALWVVGGLGGAFLLYLIISSLAGKKTRKNNSSKKHKKNVKKNALIKRR